MSIKITRTEAGRYHAGNGRDILGDDNLGATIIKEDAGWVVRYFVHGLPAPTTRDTFDSLADAKGVVRLVLDRYQGDPDRLSCEYEVRRLARECSIEYIDGEIARLRAAITVEP